MNNIINISKDLYLKNINSKIQKAKEDQRQDLYKQLILILGEIITQEFSIRCDFCKQPTPEHTNSCLIMRARRLLDRLYSIK